MLKPAAGKTYAAILGEIRKGIKPEDTQTEILDIRKTLDGCVLLELGKSSRKDEFPEAITKVLETGTEVRRLEPQVSLRILDVDALVTEEEVGVAIRAKIGELADGFESESRLGQQLGSEVGYGETDRESGG